MSMLLIVRPASSTTTLQRSTTRLSEDDWQPGMGASRQPEWLDIELAADTTIPGCPSFVTAAWFRRHSYLSPTKYRQLRKEVVRKRRSQADFLAWLPDAVAYEDLHWILARAAVTVGDSVDLCDLVALCGRSGAGQRSSIFDRLYTHEMKSGDVDLFSLRNCSQDILFASVYECGAAFTSVVLAGIMVSDRPLTGDASTMARWFTERHPEAYDEVDKMLRRKEEQDAQRAAQAADQAAQDVDPSGVVKTAVSDDQEPPDALATALAELAAVRVERDAMREDIDDLTYRHAELQREIAAVRAGHDPLRSASGEVVGERLPATLPELVQWIESRLSPSVHVLPRAFRSLKKAPGLDIERLARGLRFLRDIYVPFRSDEGMTGERYREALVEAGFDETASCSSVGSYEAFPGYKARWNGQGIYLDRHLKRGVGTDPRTMIRVYFHWDRETRTVVVGHMPGHLDNWLKN